MKLKDEADVMKNLFVFQFTSLELDYEPYIQHLTDIVPVLGNEGAEDRLIQLIHTCNVTCLPTYSGGTEYWQPL